jgi:hypothetical protein
MRPLDTAEAERLTAALSWLNSHKKRLTIDQKSLQDKLASTSRELDRITKEIELAENRLKEVSDS